MLRSLSIRDVVLIDRLELDFQPGLGVLTGETGSGKSILLDALGLALGVRAEARLVRHGALQALVTAEFDDGNWPVIQSILAEHGIEGSNDGGSLLLRRTLFADGRSRAFVNDQPVSISLLRQLGDALVETHGQFENQRLLNPTSHRQFLDAFGELSEQCSNVAAVFEKWREATRIRQMAEDDLAKARRDEDYLRHAEAELAELDPKPDEEQELAARRSVLMHGEKLIEAMNKAAEELNSGRGVEAALQGAIHGLERVAGKAEGRLDGVIAALWRALSEATDGLALLDKASSGLDLDAGSLEAVESRLFALRAAARKHATEANLLPALRQKLAAQVLALEDGGANVDRLLAGEIKARKAYMAAAAALSESRKQAANKLDLAVAGELAPLKMGQAVFKTTIEPVDEAAFGAHGVDRVAFQVATNPGAPLGPLKTIASGGELARFMLALKVVLAKADPAPTIIFDEVDSGVGGAVADAVGERLARLAKDFQVLVVTHSPQVAARGARHMQVSKESVNANATTSVEILSDSARIEEIARMLAGATITGEARAAAQSLLKSGG